MTHLSPLPLSPTLNAIHLLVNCLQKKDKDRIQTILRINLVRRICYAFLFAVSVDRLISVPQHRFLHIDIQNDSAKTHTTERKMN